MELSLDSIQEFFTSPPPKYLKAEECVTFIVALLCDHDSYASAIAKTLRQSSKYRVSDTILYKALDFLIGEDLLIAYNPPIDQDVVLSKGRPPIMYQLDQDKTKRKKIKDLKKLWEENFPDFNFNQTT
jgi:hypothetical protein